VNGTLLGADHAHHEEIPVDHGRRKCALCTSPVSRYNAPIVGFPGVSLCYACQREVGTKTADVRKALNERAIPVPGVKEAGLYSVPSLRKWREKREMSLLRLSKLSGVPYASLRKYELCLRPVEPERLEMIARPLGVAPSTLRCRP
jgi:hypothetical protein